MSIELTELGYGKVKIEYMAGRDLDSLAFLQCITSEGNPKLSSSLFVD